MTSLPSRVLIATVFTVAVAALLGAQALRPTFFQGEVVEDFLLNAEITDMERTESGITLPRKATLERDPLTHFAIFKTN